MKFLCRTRKRKNAAHVWIGKDTACRMYSTGGLGSRHGFEIVDSPGERSVCTMCACAMAEAGIPIPASAAPPEQPSFGFDPAPAADNRTFYSGEKPPWED
jgi:hypothetical protein